VAKSNLAQVVPATHHAPVLPLLFIVGVVAGWIDSIAGGGGLITIPVLLGLGLSPAEALGTNKLQAVFGSGSAAWHYGRAGLINFHDCVDGVLFTAVGAASGALTVQRLPSDFLRVVIPFLLIAVAVYFLARPAHGEADVEPRMNAAMFHLIFGLGLGFYDGFFGPGTGSFWAVVYVLLLGFNLTKATAHTKLMNFISNAASLAVFVVGGKTQLVAGLVMGAGQLLGAQIGARMVVTRGAKFIRPIFIFVAIGISVRLLVAAFRR
jgi:uncharacterized protein